VSTPSSDGRPDAALAPLTRALSQAFASEDGALLLARLQTLALAARAPADPVVPDTGGRIGVWEPRRAEDGRLEFARAASRRPEWRFWADVDTIPAKTRPRVVLLGESVARGYLYDPALTPAGLLGSMLGETEVVDLARTDLTSIELGGLLDGLHALEPDAVVLFGGNNWHNVLFDLAELPRLAAALRERGFAGARTVFIDEVVVPRARILMDALAATTRELQARVVVVVPEFNLRDWRGEPGVLAPVLRGNDTLAWMAAHRRGVQALGAGDLDGAAAAAAEMIDLDEGTSAIAQEILATVLIARGRAGDARARLEAARDAVFGLFLAHSPRCPADVQDVLRAKSAEHSFAVVDLPRVFERALGGDLPDRRLFLDYCHLTREGMGLAMAEVADRLGGAGAPSTTTVRPEDEAAAHLLAAIHNAHYGQGADVLRHHCARALALSPAIAKAMLAFMESQLLPGERWMCGSFDALAEHPAIQRYLAASDPRVMEKLADFGLVEAMVDAMEGAGLPARASVASLLAEEDGPDPIDLCAPARRAVTFRERGGHALAAERGYVQAFTTTSVFFLRRARAGRVSCRLTCRLPGGSGEVGVRMNGSAPGAVAADVRWQTFALELVAQAGLNRIALEWPLSPPPADAFERAARRLERGAYPDVLPVFGEVHAFTARGND
jgi:hypothetical protein